MKDNGNGLLRKILLGMALLMSIVMLSASCAQHADFPPPDEPSGAPTPEPEAPQNLFDLGLPPPGTGLLPPEPDAPANPFSIGLQQATRDDGLPDLMPMTVMPMTGYTFLPQLIIALIFICLGIYGIKNRKISKKGSKLMTIGIILLLIGGFSFWLNIGSGTPMIFYYILILYMCVQLLLTYGAFKNYRAYEKKLADRLRGIF